MTPDPVLYEQRGDVVLVTLNRPDARVADLRGAGKHFSAGTRHP